MSAIFENEIVDLANNPAFHTTPLIFLNTMYRRKQITKLDVLCLRDRFRGGRRETGHSLIIGVSVPAYQNQNGLYYYLPVDTFVFGIDSLLRFAYLIVH